MRIHVKGAPIAIVLLACGALAQTPAPEAEQCLHRTLPVTVVDSAGDPVMNLGKSNFRFHAKWAPKVLAATPGKQPARAILAIDTSGSMVREGPESPKWKLARAAARGVVEAAGANPLALVTFGTKLEDRLGFATPKAALIYTIEGIGQHVKESPTPYGGKTALFDSVMKAADFFVAPHGRDTISLITDGGENSSRANFSDLQRFLIAKGVRLFSIGLWGIGSPKVPDEAHGIMSLYDLSHESGGQMLRPVMVTEYRGYSAEGIAEMAALGKYTYMLAQSSYSVDIELQHPDAKATKLTLELLGADGKRLPKTQALYPHELAGCRVQP